MKPRLQHWQIVCRQVTTRPRLGDVAPIATMACNRPMIRAMTFPSTGPQNTAHEKMKEAILASFPPRWRRAIFMAGASVSEISIELRPPVDREAMLTIVRAFQEGFPGLPVVLNGLGLEDALSARCMPWTPESWPPGIRPPSWWDD
jgi:hypothetical protein